MSAYTITVTLTAEEDATLRARALRAGRAPEELLGLAARAPALLGDALLEEYHRLVDVELAGRLTDAQAERRRAVEARLDERDARNPVEQAMDARVRETSDKLDAVLDALRRQPLLPTAPASVP